MFLHAYGYTVERTDGFLVLGEVGIEEGCAFEGSSREEFSDAIRLGIVSYFRDCGLIEERGHTAFCASAARRRKALMTVVELISPFASCTTRSST